MKKTVSILPELRIRDLLDQFPQAAVVFLNHRMTCVGCSMSAFDTLGDAARIYRLPLGMFLQELRSVAALPPAEAE